VNTLAGWILIIVALVTMLVVFWMVSQEKHEHEEHYIPTRAPEGAVETTAPIAVMDAEPQSVE